MYKKLSKTQKVVNLLMKGKNVSWKTLRSRFDLTSPTKLIHTLRKRGFCIYENKVDGEVNYRLGTPSKAIIAAGIEKVLDTQYAY
jgi:exonuclease I|tara:strand:- start:60 stop:314 length:255 start_codon:yes stop_codon:yes gene_type:complete